MAEQIVRNANKTEKTVAVIKSGFGWFGVALIALGYMAFSFLAVREKDATFLEILLRTAVSFLVGFSINRMLDIQGTNTGLSTDSFIEVDKEHYQATKELGKDRNRLRKYTMYLNREGLKEARTTILSYEGLVYEDYFDKKGKYIGKHKKLTKGDDKFEIANKKAHNKCVNKAIWHKVTQLSPQSLLSDDVKILDPNYQGSTLSDYVKKSVTKDIIGKLAPAFVVGRIGVAFAEGVSWASFIMAGLEISLYILMGFIKYYNAYTFVTKVYKQRIINKTLQLRGIKDWVEEEEENYGNESRRTVTETVHTGKPTEGVSESTISNGLQSGSTSTSGTAQNEQNGSQQEQKPTIGTIVLNKSVY